MEELYINSNIIIKWTARSNCSNKVTNLLSEEHIICSHIYQLLVPLQKPLGTKILKKISLGITKILYRNIDPKFQITFHFPVIKTPAAGNTSFRTGRSDTQKNSGKTTLLLTYDKKGIQFPYIWGFRIRGQMWPSYFELRGRKRESLWSLPPYDEHLPLAPFSTHSPPPFARSMQNVPPRYLWIYSSWSWPWSYSSSSSAWASAEDAPSKNGKWLRWRNAAKPFGHRSA